MKRTTILSIAGALLVPALAFAQPKTPDDWYKEGENQYNLGNFDKAVDAFKKGFELEPSDSKKAAYLFNIAQAYRQANNCKDAQFFYKRYLAFKDADTKKPLAPDKRKEIEDRIKELEECAKTQDTIRNKPPDTNPDGNKPPDGDTTPKPPVVGDVTKPPGDGIKDEVPPETPAAEPRTLAIRLEGGAVKVSAGDLEVPAQASFALVGGYPLPVGDKLTLELGAAFTFSPVPFEDAMAEKKTSTMTGLLANVGARYKVQDKIGVRGDLGLGVLLFGGASGSPFTDFAETSGSLSMLNVRVGVTADYLITPNIAAFLTPIAFSYSPGKDGLQVMGEKINAITSASFLVGVGYRM